MLHLKFSEYSHDHSKKLNALKLPQNYMKPNNQLTDLLSTATMWQTVNIATILIIYAPCILFSALFSLLYNFITVNSCTHTDDGALAGVYHS